jgi:hypothetical protein
VAGTIDLFSNFQTMQARRIEDGSASNGTWINNRQAESRGTGVYNGLADPIDTGNGRMENKNQWMDRTHPASTYAKVAEILTNPRNMPSEWNPWKQIPKDQQNFAIGLIDRELRANPDATAWVPASVAVELGVKEAAGTPPDQLVPVQY